MEEFTSEPIVQLYEIMFMIPGSVDVAEAAASQAKALEIIAQFGGKVTSQYNMGRRKLAYRIGQHSYGHYMVVQFESVAEKVNDIDTKFRLDSEILRHQVVKATPMTAEELELMIEGTPEQREAQAAAEAAYAEKMAAKTATAAHIAAANEAEATPVAEAPAKEVEADDVAQALPATEEATPAVEVVEEPKAEVAPAKEEVKEEELDQKLDAILEDADLQEKL